MKGAPRRAQAHLRGFVEILGRRWFAAALVGLVLIETSVLLRPIKGRYRVSDFSHFYVGAFVSRTGGDPYTAPLASIAAKLGLDVEGTPRLTATPTFMMMMQPLAGLQPAAAHRIWIALNVAALIAARTCCSTMYPRFRPQPASASPA